MSFFMNSASWLKQINRKKTINGNTYNAGRCFTMSEADVKTQRCHLVNKVAVNTVSLDATRVPRWCTSLRANIF
jgi:hypothetical protein